MATTAIVDLLVKIGLLDDRQHDVVMSRAQGGNGGELVREIAEQGFATESTVARVLSVELGLPRVDLAITPPEHEALGLLDMKICTERFVLPVALRDNGEMLWLAMGDPTDTETMSLVRRRTGKRVRPVVAGPTEIAREARRLYVMPQTPGTLSNTNALPGSTQPSGGIELEAPESANEAFEVVGVGDDSAEPLARIAAQLGVDVPEMMARRRLPPSEGVEIDLSVATDAPVLDARPMGASERAQETARDVKPAGLPPKPAPRPVPRTLPVQPAGRASPKAPPPEASPATEDDDEVEIEEVLEAQDDDPLSPRPASRWPFQDDLEPEDVLNLEALRASMEKGALVLRALAELCLEKGVFTREEMRKRNK